MTDTTTQTKYDPAPPGVRARIERGEVPDVPLAGDNPIDVLRYNIAVAEEKGDWTAVLRLNQQWAGLKAQGIEGDFEAKGPDPFGLDGVEAGTRGDLEEHAAKAREDSDDAAAARLWIGASRAPEHRADPELLEGAHGAEDAMASAEDFPSRTQATEQAIRANLALRQQIDGVAPPQPVTVPALPDTHEGLEAASQEALATGDLRAAIQAQAAKGGLTATTTQGSPTTDDPNPQE